MEETESSSQIHLKDGSVFAIGGVKSTLAQLVDVERIAGESILFSIGPAKADEESQRVRESRGKRNSEERYKVSNEIARGGMGSILRTEDLDLRRFVAMKVLLEPGETTEKMYERFIKEAQVTGFLEHPNIIPVHELGLDKNLRPFFTMKLIGGESLASVLNALRRNNAEYRKDYPIRRLLGTFIQVCNAVSFAHSRGVIHRDLKPENVMLGEFGEVLVMDWGLAKIRDFDEILSPHNVADPDDYTQTQEGVVLGTPLYMPPEQAVGDIANTDERSDVFSLGAILYEIVTGRMLYDGATVAEIINKAASVDFKPPSTTPKGSTDIEKICLRSIQKQKQDRYQSVGELADAVRAYLDHRVIPDYGLRPWQKIAQSVGIAAFFVLLIPLLNLGTVSNFATYFHISGAIMIVAIAFLFHAVVVGRGLSPFREMSSLPEARSYGTIVLLEGSFWGGLLGTLSGFFAMIGNLDEARYLGPNISLSLMTVLYFLAFYIIVRLESVRELRRSSLFDSIAENSLANLYRYIVLFMIPFVVFVSLVLLSDVQSLKASFESFSLLEFPGHIPLYPVVLYLLALVFSLTYTRFIFTFRELIAALEHIFAFLAGNEVADENRVHAASVLRLFVETYLLSTLTAVSIVEISFLADMEDANRAFSSFLFLFVVGLLPFCLYIGINYLLIPRFVGYRGAVESTSRMRKALCAYYKQHAGSFWSDAKYGRGWLIGANLGLVVFYVMSLITAGAFFGGLGPPEAISACTMICVLAYANRKRQKLRGVYRDMDARATK
jgi:serine/threonine protein kinase